MRKLHVRTLMLTALAATALSACGAKRVFDEDIDISVNTKGTEIILWTGFGASVSSALDTVLEEFTDATGIKATHESQGGYDNLQKAINGSASSMTYPNVCVGYPDHFAGYIDSDIQMRLDVFIEQDKKLWEEREDKKLDDAKSGSFYELPAFDLDDFYPNYMVENQSLEFDEEGNPYTLGIPFNKSSEVMVYNKTFFESSLVQAAGITLPKTWLEAPTVKSAKKVSAGVTVTWSKVKGAETYTVMYKEKGGEWKTAKSKVTGTSYTVPKSKLVSGKTYYFTVKAVGAATGGYTSGKSLTYKA